MTKEACEAIVDVKYAFGEEIKTYEVLYLYLFDVMKATYLPEGVFNPEKINLEK